MAARDRFARPGAAVAAVAVGFAVLVVAPAGRAGAAAAVPTRRAWVQGEFTPHRHPDTDEFFLVLSGRLVIRMDDGDVTLDRGDTFVVPRGRLHQPCAESETTILLFEPSETVNTGDTPSELTASRNVVA